MTEGMKLPELLVTEDGRKWSVEIFGPGEKVKVTDIMSPTGYHEWVDAEKAGITWTKLPPPRS